MAHSHSFPATTESCRLRRPDVVEYARTLLNTPFVHQGRLEGVGIDCIGALVCIAKHFDIPHKDHKSYSRKPNGTLIKRLVNAGLIERPNLVLEPCSVLVFEIRREPYHVGIMTSAVTMLHTHSGVGCVVEHRLDHKWLKRLHSVWEFPVKWQQ